MQPNGDKTHDHTHRLTVNQAAEVLGTTAEAVRQRIKRGTLAAEKDESGGVFVFLEANQYRPYADPTRPDGDHTNKGTPDPPKDLLVEALQDQIDQLNRQLDEANRANAEHRRLLAAALELAKRPAIEAPEPRDASETGTESEAGTGAGASGTTEPRASWWRRFFGFE